MEFKTARERLNSSDFWLKKIIDEYAEDHFTIESYSEAFFINSRSVCDYVITDFLQTKFPNLSLEEVYSITKNSRKYRDGDKKLSDDGSNKILVDFLKKYQEEYKGLTTKPLVAYFFTLRNLLTHFGFPSIFNIKEENGSSKRHFNHEFVQFLLTENGNRLVTENGTPISLNQPAGTIKELDYVDKLDSEQKGNLVKDLDDKDPVILLTDFLKEIKKFVSDLEQ